jgi:hypothetical protein
MNLQSAGYWDQGNVPHGSGCPLPTVRLCTDVTTWYSRVAVVLFKLHGAMPICTLSQVVTKGGRRSFALHLLSYSSKWWKIAGRMLKGRHFVDLYFEFSPALGMKGGKEQLSSNLAVSIDRLIMDRSLRSLAEEME